MDATPIEEQVEQAGIRIGGARKQFMIGDIVNVEGHAFRISAMLNGGRITLKAARNTASGFGPEGVRARQAMADDLARHAEAAGAEGRTVNMTPRVVLEVLVPALRAVR